MKQTKSEAKYVPAAPRRHCQNCAYYRAGACTEVSGAIAPLGSCKLYATKKAAT